MGPSIQKQRTAMREPISPEEKLAVTLRFLATGETYESLMYQFRIHKSTISRFVPVVCQKIWDALKSLHMQLPSTSAEWENIASETEKRWQFPNCIGAADGKHVAIIHPSDSGSEFYNYKGFYSIVLMALL